MFDVLPQAGVSAAEFAGIVGVTRVSVHNWIAGRKSPHKLVRARVSTALKVLQKLVDAKKLPLDRGIEPEVRRLKLARLKEIVDRALQTASQ